MAMTLPAWVLDDAESVRREAERYRSMSPEERAHLMAAACRAAARLLQGREDRDVVLAHEDPLPDSTRQALARLRRAAAARGGRNRDDRASS